MSPRWHISKNRNYHSIAYKLDQGLIMMLVCDHASAGVSQGRSKFTISGQLVFIFQNKQCTQSDVIVVHAPEVDLLTKSNYLVSERRTWHEGEGGGGERLSIILILDVLAAIWPRSRLGSQVNVRCSVVTSWETGKLVLQLMFYLHLLFQNTWSFINWWLYILWYTRIDHSHVLLIVMHELGWFELVCVKSLMKSQSHETKSSMKLTGGGIYDQSTRNRQHIEF